MTDLIPPEIIKGKIHFIRDRKVILDRDLAELYGLQTKALKQLMTQQAKPKKKIGFTVKEKQAKFGHGGKAGKNFM